MKSSVSSVLRWCAVGLGVVTAYFTMNAYLAKFGADSWVNIGIAGAIGAASAVIQAICVFFIPRINYKPIRYLMVATCCLITAFTVYGLDFKATQGIQKAIEGSFSYQMKQSIAEGYRDAAKTQQEYKKSTRSAENLDKANDLVNQLDSERNTGANSTDTRADFENMQIFGFNISNAWKKAAGLLIDTMYYLVLWLLFFGVAIAKTKRLQDILPEDDEPLSGKRYLEHSPAEHSENGNGTAKKNSMNERGNRGRKTQATKREKRLEKLRSIRESGERFSTKKKLADKIGIGTETLNDYMTELDLDFDADFSTSKNNENVESARQFEVNTDNSTSKFDTGNDTNFYASKSHRKKALKKLIDDRRNSGKGDPTLSEMMGHVGVPGSTIRKYLEEMGYYNLQGQK